jgi:hypothetical protein
MDALSLRFLDNLADEELFGFPSALECLHGGFYSSSKWDGVHGCRNVAITLIDLGASLQKSGINHIATCGILAEIA